MHQRTEPRMGKLAYFAAAIGLFSTCTVVSGLRFPGTHASYKLSPMVKHFCFARNREVNRMAVEDDDIDVKTFFLGNEGEFVGDVKKLKIDLPRFVAYNLLAVALAFGSNFLGVTSVLMSSTNPEYFRSAGLDQLYSVGGFRRHVDVEDKYEYIFPENWLFDRSIMLADARERDMPKNLRDRKQLSVRPDSAYGPDGRDGKPGDFKENISVIKSNVMPGFTLKGTLGEPREAAERLLQNMIAAPGSGKSYVLLDAYAESREGSPAYVFEYTIKKEGTLNSNNVMRGGFYQHSVSVVMSRGTELFTLTGVAPESTWGTQKQTIDIITKSFKIAAPSVPEGFY
jgi:PsbP